MGASKRGAGLGRALRVAAYGIAATAAVVALSVVPAQADETAPAGDAGTCAGGRICMWEDSNYSGSRYANWPPTGHGDTYQIDGWDGDNEISSVLNNTRYHIRLYDNDNWTGTSRCFDPGEGARSLGGFDNEAESAKVVSHC